MLKGRKSYLAMLTLKSVTVLEIVFTLLKNEKKTTDYTMLKTKRVIILCSRRKKIIVGGVGWMSRGLGGTGG